MAYRRWLPLVSILAAICCGTFTSLEAQRRLGPRPIPYSELDREEGERRLAEMRQMGIEGVYSFLFELRVMPRRGKETVFRGQMWGSRNDAGPVYRYDIWEPGRQEERVLRFLIQNGPRPEMWVYDSPEAENGVRLVGVEEIFAPIPGTSFVPFDLQMPFIYWEDFSYEGLSRVRGRSSHGFLMEPPAAVAEEHSWLRGVRMFIDAEFNAMTGAEIAGTDGEVLRAFNIIDIKGIDDQWFPKTIDFRDETTGNKTRLSLQAAAMRLPREPFSFSPETLAEPLPALPRERFTFF